MAGHYFVVLDERVCLALAHICLVERGVDLVYLLQLILARTLGGGGFSHGYLFVAVGGA
jgi:hypothetical protein